MYVAVYLYFFCGGFFKLLFHRCNTYIYYMPAIIFPVANLTWST